MVQEKPIVNAVNKAYAYLLEQTSCFRFYPDAHINEGKLATTLDMSRAPVREALNRLAVEGMVTFKPGKGFYCRKLSTSEVLELYEIRANLELAALLRTCVEASDEEVMMLETWWKAEEAALISLSMEKLIDLDETFHIKLASLSGNAERINILQNINARIRFVRKINLENPKTKDNFICDHSKILTAVATRNEKDAYRLLHKHVTVNSEDIKDKINFGLTKIFAAEIA